MTKWNASVFPKHYYCAFSESFTNVILTHVNLRPSGAQVFCEHLCWELEEWLWGCCRPAVFLLLSVSWLRSLATPHLLVYPPCPRAKLFNFAPWKLRGQGRALQDLHRAGLCWWDKLEMRLKEAAPFIRVHWPRFWLCFFISCLRNRLGKWLLVT